MSEHYDFHYQPTGSGAISGQQVLQQTEDAINELGDYVNDNVGGAMDVAQQALETAQNAEQDAQTALDTANSFSSAIQTAQQDASTALSTAQTAQTTASNANNTAIQAQQDASSAVTTANNASGQVSTLSGTVTTLGQRVTTAEGNIGQNTSDITSLTTRVGTAEGNITTLQNDVTIAQGNASSAMATAGTVKQQAFVFRYSSTALTASSTNSNTLLDNTDNLKVGDKVIDSDGVLFSITAIDTANSTFTVGSALIDLALDANVVHTSGNETVGGSKTFSATPTIYNSDVNESTPDLYLQNQLSEKGNTANPNSQRIVFTDKNTKRLSQIQVNKGSSGETSLNLRVETTDNSNNDINSQINYYITKTGTKNFVPNADNDINLGSSSLKWKNIYSTNYYYGSNNVEFSTKFVTTDTNQIISGNKTFSENVSIYNSDASVDAKYLIFKNQKVKRGSTTETGTQFITFQDKDSGKLVSYETNVSPSGNTQAYINVSNLDANSQRVVGGVKVIKTPTETWFIPDGNNSVSSGLSNYKWSDVVTYKVNGLTPSSLSLPSGNANDFIDISSYFANRGTGEENSYTASANGWIYLRLGSISGCQAGVYDANNNRMWGQSSTGGVEQITIPILKGQTLVTQWNTSSSVDVAYARFIPCQGNV